MDLHRGKEIKEHSENNIGKFILIFLFLTLIVVFLRILWISDDSEISMRFILNFVSGNGLLYNIGERIQGFTHPLWLLILSLGYFISGKIFLTTLFFSLLFSLGAVWVLIYKISDNRYTSILILLLLLFSQAFIDYTSSGLENPLSFFLISIFFLYYLKYYRDKISYLYLLSSLIFLNRPDLILIPLPVLVRETFIRYREVRKIKKIFSRALIGFSPAIFWLIFSTFYYGFPLPNTAFAKLCTGISHKKLLLQGICYFLDSLKYDPITLLVIFSGILFSFFYRFREKKLPYISTGIILYLLYILYIGGDFMAGRFLSVPFFTSLIILSSYEFQDKFDYGIIFLLILISGYGSLRCGRETLFRKVKFNIEEDFIRKSGICNERGYYFARSQCIINTTRNNRELKDPGDYFCDKIKRPRKTRVEYMVGYNGLFERPDTYILDRFALVDPLLSRLKVKDVNNWRIGHFERKIPIGYFETVALGKNLIKDKSLREYYDKLHLVVSGKLFSFNRLKEIVKLNFGRYNYLLKKYEESSSKEKDGDESILKYVVEDLNSVTLNYSSLKKYKIKKNGDKWDINTLKIPCGSYLRISLGRMEKIYGCDLSVDGNDEYNVWFTLKENKSFYFKIPSSDDGGLKRISKKMDGIEADSIIIWPSKGDSLYSLGHFLLEFGK